MDLLKLSIEQFTEIVNNGSIELQKLKNDLIACHEEAIKKKQDIDNQLNIAKVNRIQNDKFADPDWFRRAMYAKKCAGQECVKIQRMLSIVGSKIRLNNSISHEHLFIDAARIVLDEDTFAKILNMIDYLKNKH